MKGLSSTALQNTTSLAQPKPPRSAVRSAAALTVSAHQSLTASMLMPARVEPTLTEEHTSSVRGQRFGNGADELDIGLGHALLHQSRVAAEEVDAHRVSRPVQRLGEGDIVLGVAGRRHQGDGGDARRAC